MKNAEEIQAVLIRMEREKYLRIRHELLDRGKTFSEFANEAISRHFKELTDKVTEQ